MADIDNNTTNNIEKNDDELRFNFGTKHKGELISNVIKTDAPYVRWAVGKGLIKLPKFLKL
jgi:hypothetical protein